MTPEQQLRQRIQELETTLALQALELEGKVLSSIKSLELKSIIIQSLSAVVQYQPLRELVFKSTLRFAAFKMGKILLKKLLKFRRTKVKSE